MTTKRARRPDREADRLMRETGKNLATWRNLTGLTQEQVAARADVSRQVIARIEKGDGGFTFESFARVLRVLQVGQDVVTATDPLSNPLGRALIEEKLGSRNDQLWKR